MVSYDVFEMRALVAFSALTLLVGWQEWHPACKNWVVLCWHGYLSGAWCRFAYGRADLIATHCLLLQEIQIGFGFTFLVPAYLASPGQNLEGHKMAVVFEMQALRQLLHLQWTARKSNEWVSGKIIKLEYNLICWKKSRIEYHLSLDT